MYIYIYIRTTVTRPRRPKQYCLQLDIALWYYKQSFGFMFKLSTLSRKSHVSLLCILNSLSSLSPLAWLE